MGTKIQRFKSFKYNNFHEGFQILNNSPKTLNNLIDYFVWGYFSSLHENVIHTLEIFNKISSLCSLERSNCLKMEEKNSIYKVLVEDFNLDIPIDSNTMMAIPDTSFQIEGEYQIEEEKEDSKSPDIKSLNVGSSDIKPPTIESSPIKSSIIEPSPIKPSSIESPGIKLSTSESSANKSSIIESSFIEPLTIKPSITEPLAIKFSIPESLGIESSIVKEEKTQEPSNLKLTCAICLQDFDNNDYTLQLTSCNHHYHFTCLAQHAREQIKEGNVPISCPEVQCRQIITDINLGLLLENHEVNKHQRMVLTKYIEEHSENASWCPTSYCDYIFYIEIGDNPHFGCPNCLQNYCLRCRVAYHEGMTCSEYQISHSELEVDRQFFDLAKGIQLKQCPKCKYWVEKTIGCNQMKCRCGNQFCYSCGGNRETCECGVFIRR